MSRSVPLRMSLPLDGQHEGHVLELAQVPAKVLVVGAVAGREERRHSATDVHDLVRVTPEQLDRLRARVLGVSQHEVGRRHPRGSAPVAIEVRLGGKIPMRARAAG